MSCCGHGRRAAATWVRAAPLPAPRAAAPEGAGGLPLRYLGGAERALAGPASGRVYRVGPGRRAVAADPADVRALLATGLFAEA